MRHTITDLLCIDIIIINYRSQDCKPIGIIVFLKIYNNVRGKRKTHLRACRLPSAISAPISRRIQREPQPIREKKIECRLMSVKYL